MEFRALCDVVLPGNVYIKQGTVIEFDAAPSRHWVQVGNAPAQQIDAEPVPADTPARRRGRPRAI